MEEILGEAKDEISRGKKKGIKVILKNYATESQLDKMKAKGFYAHFQYDGGAWAMAYLRYLKGTNKGVFTNSIKIYPSSSAPGEKKERWIMAGRNHSRRISA